jgi:hypothetical protein
VGALVNAPGRVGFSAFNEGMLPNSSLSNASGLLNIRVNNAVSFIATNVNNRPEIKSISYAAVLSTDRPCRRIQIPDGYTAKPRHESGFPYLDYPLSKWIDPRHLVKLLKSDPAVAF